MKRRVLIAGWIAGLVMGLSSAWWWGNAYVALFVLLGGVAFTVTAWIATASDDQHGTGQGGGR